MGLVHGCREQGARVTVQKRNHSRGFAVTPKDSTLTPTTRSRKDSGGKVRNGFARSDREHRMNSG